MDPAAGVRWTDRTTTDGTWSGNLLDFYRRVYPRLVDGLKVPFRLGEGAQRVDETPVHEALREALVNTLVHADYELSTGILVVRQPDHFEFRNPGGLRVPRALALQGGVSDCRNRNLQKMFQMIGAGEQAGSGVPRILEAWREQHWRAPLLEEQLSPEMTTLRLSMMSLFPAVVIDQMEEQFGDRYRALPELDRLALATACAEGQVTNERLREMSNAHPSDLTVLLRRLVDTGYLDRQGSGRGASYQLRGGDLPLQAGLFGDDADVATHSSVPSRPPLHALDPRQRLIVAWVRQHGSISTREHREIHQVARTTAARDLQILVNLGVLRRVGESRAARYEFPIKAVPDS
jgi:predicted HTH transcriptional regulator